MTALAHLPNQWNPETTTAQCATTEPVGLEMVSKLVTADSARRGTLISSEDGCILPKIQEGNLAGRVRSLQWRA